MDQNRNRDDIVFGCHGYSHRGKQRFAFIRSIIILSFSLIAITACGSGGDPAADAGGGGAGETRASERFRGPQNGDHTPLEVNNDGGST